MASKTSRYEEMLKGSKVLTKMHLPEQGKDSPLHSFHQISKQKTSWYISSWESMTAQNAPTNPNLVNYRSKIYPYHGLHRSILTTVTPRIKAKEGYTVKFCDDLFINMVKEFRLVFNETEIQFGNTPQIKFDLKRSSDWENYKEEIGNKYELTSWSETLESSNLSLFLPWTYSRDKSDYFPLQLCGNSDTLSHIIEFNLDLENLLLIQNSNGEIVEFSEDLITVDGNLNKIPIPELEGLYTTLTSSECKNSHCIRDGLSPDFFSYSSYYCEDENSTVLGKKIQIKFDSKKTQPVYEVLWGAQNTTLSEKTKDLCFKYQVDEHDLTPIKMTKLENSVGIVLNNKSSYKTEKGYDLVKGKPSFTGMNRWENNVLLNEDKRKFPPSICFNGGNIVVTLDDYKSEDKFLVFAILKFVTRFKFTSYPKTQEERLKFGATIEGEEIFG